MRLNQNNTRSQKQKLIVSKANLPSSSGRVDAEWKNDIKNINGLTSTLCHHVLSGRVKAHKLCLKNYECFHCAYDQMIDDENMEYLREKAACQ